MPASHETAAADASAFIRHVRLAGRTRGLVKALGGFNKKHHSLPDAVNAATTAFLGKLCAEELAEECEAFFQKTRAALGYKRRELSLDVASPSAVLTARDFTLEWDYTLDEDAPDEWVLTRTLHGLRGADVARAAAFDALFAGMFERIVFGLKKGASVESVIDAVEGLGEDESGDEATGGAVCGTARLKVDYPSDCRCCTLRVEGVTAEVEFDGGELAMVFPRAGSPSELIDAFAEVRRVFVLSKSRALAGLL
ncbi:hypothetical protein AW736_12670 [Termitidicoccus mucosus]|uniref:Uncharacterized protein n=2 Tax=Termitidicoccus mucosus TaxID=1184151 RepID=A0A178IIE7_9BACT|nr:hypothetical protein AW736_12670 [Opitutaceae bacterium TSB47]